MFVLLVLLISLWLIHFALKKLFYSKWLWDAPIFLWWTLECTIKYNLFETFIHSYDKMLSMCNYLSLSFSQYFFSLCIVSYICCSFWVFWPWWLCSYSTNASKQGQLDVELNETGRQQAAAVSCICRVF